jgi:hypothetical protein
MDAMKDYQLQEAWQEMGASSLQWADQKACSNG